MMALNGSIAIPLNNTVPETSWVAHTVLPNLILTACFLIGVPGNCFVVWTILTKFSRRSVILILILNLTMADLMALLTAPFWMYDFATRWDLGETFCKLLVYLDYLLLYASIFLIMLMSLHRFALVVFPFTARKWQNLCVVHSTLLAVWLSAAVFACPTLIFTAIHELEGDCSDEVYDLSWKQIVDNVLETSFSFLIPLVVLSTCYSHVGRKVGTLQQCHQKRRTEKLIVAVVVAFFVCWLPYHIFSLLTVCTLLLKHAYPDVADTLEKANTAVANIHWAIAFISSSVNPILYAFAAQTFHGGLQKSSFTKMFLKLHEETENKHTILVIPQRSNATSEKKLVSLTRVQSMFTKPLWADNSLA